MWLCLPRGTPCLLGGLLGLLASVIGRGGRLSLPCAGSVTRCGLSWQRSEGLLGSLRCSPGYTACRCLSPSPVGMSPPHRGGSYVCTESGGLMGKLSSVGCTVLCKGAQHNRESPEQRCSGAPAAGISPRPTQGLKSEPANKSIFHLLEPQPCSTLL